MSVSIAATPFFKSQTVYNTKGARAHTHRELIRLPFLTPGSSLEEAVAILPESPGRIAELKQPPPTPPPVSNATTPFHVTTTLSKSQKQRSNALTLAHAHTIHYTRN